MSDDPLAVAERYAAAWNAADEEGTLRLLAPDVEIDWSESRAPWAGIYSGHTAAAHLYGEMLQSFDESRLEVHEYLVAGPRVAVRNSAYMRGRDGIEVVARSTIVMTVRDGKIADMRLFQEHADALAALGLG